MNETLNTIFSRKSVRSFTGASIPKDTLDLIIKAGMAAPTARDTRPWQFVVVTDKETLARLAQDLPYCKMAKDAGAAVIVVGDLNKQHAGADSDYWIMDCSAASLNILLAVESLGLGATWTAVYPNEDRIKPVRKILGLPEGMMPLNVIPIGVPTAPQKAKDKYQPERIHWEKW